MTSRLGALPLLSICFVLAAVSIAHADSVDEDLQLIAHVGAQGAGSSRARQACDRLSTHGAEILPRLLASMDTAGPVAANWYRTVFDAVVQQEFAKDRPEFPRDELRTLVGDANHTGRVRRLVLAICERLEPGFSKRVIPKLLDDAEFRQDAVEAALVAGQQGLDSGDSETAREEFQKAFEHAREATQVTRAADKLAGLGERVDVAAHLGLFVDWWVIGPFGAPKFTGFAQKFPPEDEVDLKAHYTGQQGSTIGWIRHRTADPLGTLNLVQALAPASEAVGYAYTEFVLSKARAGQIRCGADDNCSVWLNGQKVFGRDQWLNGTRFDRFITPVQLRSGTNTMLVKVCQGPQHKDPQVSNNWTVQIRLCDDSGAGLLFKTALPQPAEAAK